MNMREKNKINRDLGKVLKPIYFDQIPLGDIFDTIKSHGYVVVDEAGEPWSGFICGREGRATFDIVSQNGVASKYGLQLSWYKMPSGRYEVISYVG
jgi:hypothetical protein